MSLDLSSLDKALHSLDRASVRALTHPDDEELRDAVIQRFEYCFELSWKMLKRRLEIDAPSADAIDTMSYRELLRIAAERGFLENVDAWFEFRHQRNSSSHSYDSVVAASVFQSAIAFLPVAQQLYKILTERNDD